MTEEPGQKDSELGHPPCSMGCGHKDDKASLASSQTAPFSHQPPSTPASKEVWKKGGRMFSILLAVHLALLACTLVSSGAFEKIAVHDYDVFFLLTVMMLVVIIWIIFYLAGTSRCPGAILGKDSHAGPIWLRGRCWVGGTVHGSISYYKGSSKELGTASSCWWTRAWQCALLQVSSGPCTGFTASSP